MSKGQLPRVVYLRVCNVYSDYLRGVWGFGCGSWGAPAAEKLPSCGVDPLPSLVGLDSPPLFRQLTS